MLSTVTPVTRASGLRAFTFARISPKAARTAFASASASRTPSTSLLCTISGESIFITTGNPIDAAAAAASSAPAARTLLATGMR
jgi:hypothetical protein